MHDGAPPRDRPGGPPGPDPHQLARDWVTLWQSELAAAAADREVQETWQTLAGLWASVAGAMLASLPRAPHDAPAATGAAATGAAASPRPAPAAAASDPRDAEIQRLARGLADLERRLADLERPNPPGETG